LKLRRTDAGGVCLDRDACKESGDPVLIEYGELAQYKAVLAKDVPMLAAGVHAPIHTSMGLAATGRSTSAGPNLQNMRRLPGIREAFRPRPGHVFAQADYPGLELHTLAQACLDLVGHSELAQIINSGKDPHLAFAATLLGITYEEAAKRKKDPEVDAARQIGKVFNFGKPGGLGAEKLVLFARKTYGVTLTVDQVRARTRTWTTTLPEMRDYFALVGRMTENDEGRALFQHLRSGRWRGGAGYTAACNSFFQGLGADAAKSAGYAVSHACYAEPESPLYGSRIVLFIHDELILEVAEERAHDAAVELSRVMREAANEWVPDVPFAEPDPEPLLMRTWSKKAEAVRDSEGRLVPWDLPTQQVAA
jgi:DNA polymerase I-like protein with 3'-5' exonuclease and polymerase domains